MSLEIFNSSLQLAQKRATNQPGADHADRESLVREIEGGMYRSQGSGCFSLFDDSGDISSRRSLGDCPHVDAGLRERAEKFSGHTQALDHAVADHRNDAT